MDSRYLLAAAFNELNGWCSAGSDAYFYDMVYFFKQKTAYEMRISDWSSDVCSSDLADGRRKDHVYWTLSFAREAADLEASADHWEGQVRAALDTAVARRMVSDVPVGVLLSGGVDSSLIVALLAEAGQKGLKTFRSEEHTSEIQSLMRHSYAVFYLKKTKQTPN